MEAWVGPAIVAAVISGLVSLIVVQLNFAQGRKIERRRREEKIRDFQIALRAEIRSELANLSRFDLDGVLLQMERRYAEEPDFSVSVPRVTKHIVFEAIVGELHILPEAVIGPRRSVCSTASRSGKFHRRYARRDVQVAVKGQTTLDVPRLSGDVGAVARSCGASGESP